MRPRTLILAGALVALVATAAANQVHVDRLERSLVPLVEEEVRLARQHADRYQQPLSAIVHTVVVAKDFMLFGGVTGKASLYIQQPDGSEEGHIEVIEIHYRKDEGVWHKTDSAVCASEACTREGLALIRALEAEAEPPPAS